MRMTCYGGWLAIADDTSLHHSHQVAATIKLQPPSSRSHHQVAATIKSQPPSSRSHHQVAATIKSQAQPLSSAASGSYGCSLHHRSCIYVVYKSDLRRDYTAHFPEGGRARPKQEAKELEILISHLLTLLTLLECWSAAMARLC